MRARHNKPLLKQNHSQRQGKGHQPCVLHKAVNLTASRRWAADPGSRPARLSVSPAPFGAIPDLATQGMVPSLEDWVAQLPPPVASHFPSCLAALLVLLADRWGSR